MPRQSNSFHLTGNLTAPCELKRSSGGTTYLRGRVGNHRPLKTDDGWTDQTWFFDFVLFGRDAEEFDRLQPIKGQEIVLSGLLETRDRPVTRDGDLVAEIPVIELRVTAFVVGQPPNPKRPATDDTAPAATAAPPAAPTAPAPTAPAPAPAAPAAPAPAVPAPAVPAPAPAVMRVNIGTAEQPEVISLTAQDGHRHTLPDGRELLVTAAADGSHTVSWAPADPAPATTAASAQSVPF
ncbi:single-stranded DNA-binding protein [Conexibacter sp. W3-3-2]|uniref:single-stranded DNA-binding protein n=1 Tax=Conexibacter sp. W3-3-2 TaxID=2675227 RepID=UPI0012BA151A|nr:single-stranded DNA-binding protein [Conexibacter sp. W3-3-2]MTD47175.1 single-stranded DNA-binding protein [Conexibacter sp. W3-3-2]